MINTVSIRHIDIIIWFGGACCKPIACLSSENTMSNLVKLVTINRSVGASAKSVNIITILIVFTNWAGSSIAAIDRLTTGKLSAANSEIEKIRSVNMIFKNYPVKNYLYDTQNYLKYSFRCFSNTKKIKK